MAELGARFKQPKANNGGQEQRSRRFTVGVELTSSYVNN